MKTREELEDELTAILGASRELTPDTDRFLAARFVDGLERPLPVRRQARSILPRARTPRRQFVAMLITALVLAVGTPVSLQAIRTHTQPFSTVCSWQTQSLVFDSRDAEASWLRTLDPKSYKVLGNRFDANGKVTIQASHWDCS